MHEKGDTTMKKKALYIAMAMLIILTSIAYRPATRSTAAIKPDETVEPMGIFDILKEPVDVQVANSVSALATTPPSGTTITWRVSDSRVATVSSSGVVTGIRPGQTNLTAVITIPGATTMTRVTTVNVLFDTTLFYIKNKNSGQYLTVAGAVDASGQNVTQTKITGVNNAAKLWAVTYVGNGLYKLVPQHGSKIRSLCIDITGTNGNVNSANAMIKTDSSSTNQRFKLILNDDLCSYQIASQCSNYLKVLSVVNASCDENANVFQYTHGTSMNDDWVLEPYTYSWNMAKNYAYANWNTQGGSVFFEMYPWFPDGDCTNFVSQCMLAGGIQYQNEWLIYKKNNNATMTPTASQLDGGWELATIDGGFLGLHDGSPWISAPRFGDFWSEKVQYNDFSGSQLIVSLSSAYNANYTLGDVIQIYDVDLFGNASNAWHTMLITGKSSGNYYLTYHSIDHKDAALSDKVEDEYIYRFFKMR